MPHDAKDKPCDCPYCQGEEGYRLASTPLPPGPLAPLYLIHHDPEKRESRYVLPPGEPDPVTGATT